MRSVYSFLSALLAALAAASPARGSEADSHLAIIVNRSNPVDEVDLAELRRIFRIERIHWTNGRKVTVVMREPGQPERVAALRLIYGTTESDLKRHFLHALFTGEIASPPKLLSTSTGVKRFVFHVPGAIGYVRADEIDDSVKVLRVDGRLPGEPGYGLTLTP